jgi:hypothetical protein
MRLMYGCIQLAGVREIYCIAVYIQEYVAVGRLSTFV